MTRNAIYREAIEKAIPEIAISDGRVLVTGASGLIGSCLVDLLLLANDYGRNFDVYALGRNMGNLKKRFSAFDSSASLHFVEQDIQMPLDNGIQYDYIVHGASNSDPRNYALYPVETMLINLSGAKNVLNYCKNHPMEVKKTCQTDEYRICHRHKDGCTDSPRDDLLSLYETVLCNWSIKNDGY